MHNETSLRLRLLTLLYGLTLISLIVVAGRGSLVTSYLAGLPAGDKIGHFVLMGLMAYLLNSSFGGQEFRWRRIVVLKGSLWIGILVVLEEFSQIWIAHRSFEPADLAADFAGIWFFSRCATGRRRGVKARPRGPSEAVEKGSPGPSADSV